ncbi:hypothetical protein ACIQNU_12335 [Streptomyces sp. NPDC091292]|uniref:hypothetical protein n=1 Tax=Streptomyces sp. NPDC091292 TaxID=3365991 RepID=UPI003826A902
MRQCTATADVPRAALLFAVLAGQGRIYGDDLGYAPRRVRCELGLRHEGEHADHVWDWPDGLAPPLWARWDTGGTLRFESLPWCGSEGGRYGDACALYRDHAPAHSWSVRDPDTESLRRRVLGESGPLIRWLRRKRRKRD